MQATRLIKLFSYFQKLTNSTLFLLQQAPSNKHPASWLDSNKLRILSCFQQAWWSISSLLLTNSNKLIIIIQPSLIQDSSPEFKTSLKIQHFLWFLPSPTSLIQHSSPKCNKFNPAPFGLSLMDLGKGVLDSACVGTATNRECCRYIKLAELF